MYSHVLPSIIIILFHRPINISIIDIKNVCYHKNLLLVKIVLL